MRAWQNQTILSMLIVEDIREGFMDDVKRRAQ